MPEDTCPANYTDIVFKMVSPEGEILPWRQNKSNELWIFRICFKGWTQFIRSANKRVCMKFINETGITKNKMAARCYDELPYYSKLAGVYSDEESVWMQEEIAKYTPPIGAEIKRHWTSGVRDGTCENTDSYDKQTELPDDTCPSNYTSVNFRMVSPEGEAHPWKLGANGLWVFRICKEGWKRFERSNNRTVCIKFINQTGINKARLGEICWYTHDSYVAGVQSVEESVWMRDEADKYLPTNSGPMDYWTSGMREGSCQATDPYDKKIKFVWGEEYTTGVAAITKANSILTCQQCLVIMGKMANRTQVISDYSCGNTAKIGGGFCVYDMYK
ncbi:hypothetical protein CAEBREN_16485 [Caenorhabditis brenneri]|uniref:C-type lectin domain-containing protein n=1 Tax=Caenorhabditis brenneri TaxID=135651 RepID=G0NPB5_CAEBE|nr:hypothetical protein CAEBREN_16485 [Caenorhabditis brenneri]